MAYSIYIPSATKVAFQSNCFMASWMISCTAILKKLGGWSDMQESKAGRTREWTSEGMPGLCKQALCFLAWQLALSASHVDKIVLGLSEVDRDFKFCESSFLGVRKLWEGWSLQRAVSLELFRSFKLCVTSHNAFERHRIKLHVTKME